MAKKKEVIKGSVIDKDRAAGYKVDKKVKTASGRASISCGDKVAVALKGKSVEEVTAIAKKNGLEDRLPKWKKLNPGMFRMCVGNVLRGLESPKL